jgi:hypothetical protein
VNIRARSGVVLEYESEKMVETENKKIKGSRRMNESIVEAPANSGKCRFAR